MSLDFGIVRICSGNIILRVLSPVFTATCVGIVCSFSVRAVMGITVTVPLYLLEVSFPSNSFVCLACMVKNFSGMRVGQVGLSTTPFFSFIWNKGELMEKFGIKIIPINFAIIEQRMEISKFKIFWARLTESGKHIQTGVRPVLVLGNDKTNRFSDVVTVLSISSRVNKGVNIPTHIIFSDALKKQSVILPEQIRTIPKSCLMGSCVYTLNEDERNRAKNAFMKQLGIA